MALQEGNAALVRRDYPNAESAAREVLATRTSPRAYDARLLLAQALYGQRQYAQAAIAFDDAYNSSHKGTHAQDALLGLAGSLSAISEKKAACDTLSRLRSDFPQPRPDIAAGAAATAQKTGCS
jgi:TolA-binding protein